MSITKKNFSKETLHRGDIGEWIQLVWAVAPQQMAETFSKHNVHINSEDDVQALIRIAQNGEDVAGVFMYQGSPLSFNTRSILNSVPIDNNKFVNSGITIS